MCLQSTLDSGKTVFFLFFFFPCLGKKNRVCTYSGIFQNGSFSPPLARSTERFLPIFTVSGRAPGSKLKKVKATVVWVSLQILAFRLVHILQQLVNYSSGFPIPALSPHQASVLGFCSGKLWFSVFSCLSLPSYCSGLPCDLIFLKDLRRVFEFSIFSACLGRSGDV